MKGEFYKMDFRAWNTGTVDLTLEQEAAYLRLCHAMYDARGPIPESTRFLQGIFRCGNVKAAALVEHLVRAGKIQRTEDGKLTNKRVDAELAERNRLSETRRAAGEIGGSTRRKGADREPSEGRVNAECTPSDPRVTPECTPSDADVMRSKSLKNNDVTEANASTLGSREEKRREEKTTPIVPIGDEATFQEFKAAYPARNVRFSTVPTRKRYLEAIKRGATPAALLAAAKSYAAEMRRAGNTGDRAQFVKTAEVWLNQDLWRDHVGQDPAAFGDNSGDAYLRKLSPERWRSYVQDWKRTGGRWDLADRTRPPDHPDTKVPAEILAEIGIVHGKPPPPSPRQGHLSIVA